MGYQVEQLNQIWMALDARRRAMIAGGIAALVVVVLLLTRMAGTPSMSLLYAGLEPAAAGEVISALETRGVAYSVRGDSIYVAAGSRDEMRMGLAAEGLPAMGASGYELLDSLSGFGTTSQMFDAAYWRAKEGELSRTILASPQVRAARVHIATPSNDPFQSAMDVTASVSIRPASGGLQAEHADALRFLVASSVPGLAPQSVTIVDADNGRVIGGDAQASFGAAGDHAAELRQNIERLLAARVGEGNAVVEVSVELSSSEERVMERRIDPESRVAVQTDSEERSNTSRDAGGGAVTVASNLPAGDGEAAGGGSNSADNETRERVTFDVSETQREVLSIPGALRKISVAVLVNGVPAIGDDGQTFFEARSAEELEALEALVQSAIGFDASRGDQITIRSMAFEPRPVPDLMEASGGLLGNTLDVSQILQAGFLTLVALALIFGLLRPALRRQPNTVSDLEQLPPPAPNQPLVPHQVQALSGASSTQMRLQNQSAPSADGAAIGLPNPHQINEPLGQIMSPQGEPTRQQDTQLAASDMVEGDKLALPIPTQDLSDPIERLRNLIEEREDETIEILRSWMEAEEESI